MDARHHLRYVLALIMLVSPALLAADETSDEIWLPIPVPIQADTSPPMTRLPSTAGSLVIPASMQTDAVVEEADAAAPLPEPVVEEAVDTYAYNDPLDYGAPYVNIREVFESPAIVYRLGAWGVANSGSKTGTGEWQGLNGFAPFWDVDAIRSNGYETLDFSAAGSETESTSVDLYFYRGPGFSADFDYDRFIHRLGHDQLIQPLGGFYNPPLPAADPGSPLYAEDFNPNFDNALRVQKLDASFKGQINNNLRWRLNVWGMKKEGFRQANSTQHCFNQTPGVGTTRTCHVVSQSQHVDWQTMEIEPVIEARFGWLTAEYSRTMRTFQQGDQVVFNNFNSLNTNYGLQAVGAYGIVPENYTEIDRVKLHSQLSPTNEMYVIGHVGNTHNRFRDSDRKFYGVDARLTNTTYEGLSLTTYGKTFTQNNSPDTMSLNDRYPADAGILLEGSGAPPQVPQSPQTFYPSRDPGLDHNPYISLVDRQTYSVGVKGRWRPFYDYGDTLGQLAVTGGYDYTVLNRQNVDYFVRAIDPTTYLQPNTTTNSFFVGLQKTWSYQFNSYIRYKMIDTNYPLVGVTPRQTLDLDSAINSNLPEHEDRVELGGTWNPTDNFMLTGSFWIRNTYNHSALVNFDEDSYPATLSAWYAPTPEWSFSAGVATFSNWINQDITLGREDGSSPSELAAFTSNWNYTGRSDVLNLGTTYVYSPQVTFMGGFEFVRSYNFFDAPPAPATAVPAPGFPGPPASAYSDLPGYSQVRVNTYRIQAGVDYMLSCNLNCYFRYNYFDYDDMAQFYNAGTAHMFLGGFSGVY